MLSLDGDGPLHRQTYRALRGAILSGRLRSGLRLPSSRNLAKELGLSRNTVLQAFEQLAAEGYSTTRAGSGTFVADSLLMELRNRTDLDPEVLNEVTEVMHQRLGDDGAAADNGAATEVVDQTAMKMAAEEPLQTVRRLHAEDKLDEDRVAEALGTGNHEFVTLALALKSGVGKRVVERVSCLLYTSPSPRDS